MNTNDYPVVLVEWTDAQRVSRVAIDPDVPLESQVSTLATNYSVGWLIADLPRVLVILHERSTTGEADQLRIPRGWVEKMTVLRRARAKRQPKAKVKTDEA